MSPRIILSVLVLAFLQWSCGPCEGCTAMAEKEEALAEREAALEEREAALAEREAAIAEWQVEQPSPEPDDAIEEQTTVEHPIRLGAHNLTLQWISWDEPGKAEVTFEGGNRYRIVGEQRSKENDDYLTIDGTLIPQDERTFQFEGRIAYQVSHNNGGEVCVKEGPLHFKASGKRKYWRLQEKTNCEGGMLTDYVDIYF